MSNGAINLGLGVVTLEALDLGNGTPTSDQTFTFLTATGGITGTFAGLPDGAQIIVGSTPYTIDYTQNSVGLVAVPEPSAILALVAGVLPILGLRRQSMNQYGMNLETSELVMRRYSSDS